MQAGIRLGNGTQVSWDSQATHSLGGHYFHSFKVSSIKPIDILLIFHRKRTQKLSGSPPPPPPGGYSESLSSEKLSDWSQPQADPPIFVLGKEQQRIAGLQQEQTQRAREAGGEPNLFYSATRLLLTRRPRRAVAGGLSPCPPAPNRPWEETGTMREFHRTRARRARRRKEGFHASVWAPSGIFLPQRASRSAVMKGEQGKAGFLRMGGAGKGWSLGLRWVYSRFESVRVHVIRTGEGQRQAGPVFGSHGGTDPIMDDGGPGPIERFEARPVAQRKSPKLSLARRLTPLLVVK